jgi:hypothetical protein
MAFVTTQHYEVPGGTLRLHLTTERPPTQQEREDLERIADACAVFRSHHLERTHHGSAGDLDDMDEAIWELGGEESISAG